MKRQSNLANSGKSNFKLPVKSTESDLNNRYAKKNNAEVIDLLLACTAKCQAINSNSSLKKWEKEAKCKEVWDAFEYRSGSIKDTNQKMFKYDCEALNGYMKNIKKSEKYFLVGDRKKGKKFHDIAMEIMEGNFCYNAGSALKILLN